MGGTGLVLQQVSDGGGAGLLVWPGGFPQGGEYQLWSRLASGSAEVMVCCQHLRGHFQELLGLVGEGLEGQFGVQERVVPLGPYQAGVFVVLHQPVVGPLGIGQGIQPEGVYCRQVQKLQAGAGCPQVGYVKLDDVVA